YSARFNVGELNSTYYRLPSAATINAIGKRTPDHFRIFVKLHADATHERKDPDSSVGSLLSSLKPLRDSGKLLGVLAQFPASFKYSDENIRYLLHLRALTNEIRLCAEFRDRSWDSDSTRGIMRSENITWVVPDEPQLPNLLTPELFTTSDIIYVRLHGRNARNWYHPEAGDRYDYDYSQEEMTEWGKRLIDFKEEISGGYLFFNNCHLGQAVKNATWLFQWIRDRRKKDDKETEKNDFTLSSD
ncbi:DUF72 domain-containing protein, partial [bacterium]|nr:DUF72 domain-containing protein [bacterium]